tara:strand:- start:46 stop:291 length:246 start_codon:yes stop_codon:yes gene_type:complete
MIRKSEAMDELHEKHQELMKLLVEIEDKIDLLEIEEGEKYGKVYAREMRDLRMDRAKADIHPLIFAMKEFRLKRRVKRFGR